MARVGSPLLVVHGSNDTLILPSLGRKLYEAAQQPKAFVLVEGGSHYNTNSAGTGAVPRGAGRPVRHAPRRRR